MATGLKSTGKVNVSICVCPGTGSVHLVKISKLLKVRLLGTSALHRMLFETLCPCVFFSSEPSIRTSLISLSSSFPYPVHPGPGPQGPLLPSSTMHFICAPATLPDAHPTQALTITQAWEG